MPDQLPPADPRNIWKNQAEEKEVQINMQQFLNRRAEELGSRTRSEIMVSIVAACFFLAVIVQWFSFTRELGYQVVLGIIVAWILASLYWFRRRALPPADAAAATGLEYYRRELERRRDHLRNAWVWHGPMLLASAFLVAILIGKAWPSPRLLRNMLPFLTLLVAWVAVSFYLRRREAKRIQQEIEQIGRQ